MVLVTFEEVARLHQETWPIGAHSGIGQVHARVQRRRGGQAGLDGAAGSLSVGDTLSLTGGAQQRSHPVYGRIFPRQNVGPGAYTDTLVVTLEF